MISLNLSCDFSFKLLRQFIRFSASGSGCSQVHTAEIRADLNLLHFTTSHSPREPEGRSRLTLPSGQQVFPEATRREEILIRDMSRPGGPYNGWAMCLESDFVSVISFIRCVGVHMPCVKSLFGNEKEICRDVYICVSFAPFYMCMKPYRIMEENSDQHVKGFL